MQVQYNNVVHSPTINAPMPNYSYVAPTAPQKLPSKQQQQRPVSIHSFSSLQNQNQSAAKPLSPLPLLQTNFPQYSNVQQQPEQQQPISYGGVSPRGWSHVQSPRSPGAVNQRPNLFYNNASIAPPFDLNTQPSNVSSSSSQNNFGQPQVRSEFLS